MNMREKERKYPYCDYEYLPETAWNYGFASKDFIVEEQEISDVPFAQEKPLAKIKTRLAQVKWSIEQGYTLICNKKPDSSKTISDDESVELIPYGCARLRMTEMPVVRR